MTGTSLWWRALVVAAVLASSSAPRAARPLAVGVNVQAPPRLDLVAAAGLDWVRLTIRWDEVQPAPDRWEFSHLDRLIAEAARRDIAVLGLLSWVPAWLDGGPRHNVPPRSLAPWEAFVERVARRYAGRVAAYEIWNEPDLADAGRGVGWNRDLDEPPLYADYLRAAALRIRAHAPGTLVVAPALSGGANRRTRKLLRQLESAVYPEGPASSFIDVVSIHQNAGGEATAAEAARRLHAAKLAPLARHNPANAGKPIWVTEFGWSTGEVSAAGQEERIAGLLRILGGEREAPVPLHRFRIRRAFIYKLLDSAGEERGIFTRAGAPKPVVTGYLRSLGAPAATRRPPVYNPGGAPGPVWPLPDRAAPR
jgi:hypothetical protein